MERRRRRRQSRLCRPLDQYFDSIVEECAMCSEICNYRQGSLADCASKCPNIYQKLVSTAIISVTTLTHPTLSLTAEKGPPQFASILTEDTGVGMAAGVGMTMWILIIALVFISCLVIVVLIVVVIIARRKMKHNSAHRVQVGASSNAVHQENVTIPLMEYHTLDNSALSAANRDNQAVLIINGQARPVYMRSQSAGATEKISVKPPDRQFRRSHSTGGTRSRTQSSSEVQPVLSQSTHVENQTQSTSIESAGYPPAPAQEFDQNIRQFTSSLRTPTEMHNDKRV